MTRTKPVLTVAAGVAVLAAAVFWLGSRDDAEESSSEATSATISSVSTAPGEALSVDVDSNSTGRGATSIPDSAVHEGTPLGMEPYDPRDWRALNESQLLNNHWDYRDGIVIAVDTGYLTRYLRYQNCRDVVTTSQTSQGQLTNTHRTCEQVWVYDHAYDSMPMEQLEILARTDAEAAVMFAEKSGYDVQVPTADGIQRYMNAVALANDPRVYQDFLEFRGGNLRFSDGQFDLYNAEIGYILRAAGVEIGLVEPAEAQYYADFIEANATFDHARLQREVDEFVSALNRTRVELVGDTFDQ